MKILLQFPTRQRPSKFMDYLFDYISLMEDKKDFRVHVSCDADDLTMNNDKMKELIGYFPNADVSFNDNKSKIQAVNAGVTERNFDILILASDDMSPQVKGYDNIIRGLFSTHFPNGDGVLHFNDGHQGDRLNTLCIMDRKYYDRFGYIYNEAYKSLFADNEFDEVSRILRRRVYLEQVIIKHEHPVSNKTIGVDELYVRNNVFWNEDNNTWNIRKKQNYGL